MKKILFTFVVMIFSFPLFADVIYLKNNETIEGIIKKQDDTQTVVDMGVGVFTFSNSDIIRVDKTDSKASHFFSNQETSETVALNKEEKRLTTLLYKVKQKKSLLARYHREKKGVTSKIANFKKQLVRNYRKYDDLSNALQKLSKQKVNANQTTNKIFRSRLQMDNTVARIKEIETKIDVLETEEMNLIDIAISKAGRELDAQVSELIIKYKDVVNLYPKNTNVPVYNHVKKFLEQFESLKEKKVVPMRLDGESYIVDVQLDGWLDFPFILDTGANLLVISESIADKLGIEEVDIISVRDIKIADGSIVQGKYVLLNLVNVGGFEIKNVEALIMPEKNGRISALLGMSYLKNFFFRVDNHAKQLILEKYKE